MHRSPRSSASHASITVLVDFVSFNSLLKHAHTRSFSTVYTVVSFHLHFSHPTLSLSLHHLISSLLLPANFPLHSSPLTLYLFHICMLSHDSFSLSHNLHLLSSFPNQCLSLLYSFPNLYLVTLLHLFSVLPVSRSPAIYILNNYILSPFPPSFPSTTISPYSSFLTPS